MLVLCANPCLICQALQRCERRLTDTYFQLTCTCDICKIAVVFEIKSRYAICAQMKCLVGNRA